MPKEKRLFGYFALPVLVGDEIVAAIDLKTDRERRKLLVQKWTWVGNRSAPVAQAADRGGAAPLRALPAGALNDQVGVYRRVAKKALMSGAGDLISTTTDASMASKPWRTPLGCRQTSPGPMMNSSEPTVDFTLPFTT